MGIDSPRFEIIVHAGEAPELMPESLHIHRAVFERHAGRADALERLLSKTEAERARRFRFPEHRRNYIVAHGMLREILAGYLNRAPKTITFTKGANGKPRLSPPHDRLRFNISHSDALFLCAVANGNEVGIDTEPLKTIPEAGRLLAEYFPQASAAFSSDASEAAISRRFLMEWTRHEAALKLSGAGLTGGGERLYRFYTDAFIPISGHIAAVSTVRRLPLRRYFDLQPSS